MKKKRSVIPIYTIACPLCGEEYMCVGSEIMDVTLYKGRVYACSCGYRARFNQWPQELYQNLVVDFDERGDVSVSTEDEL